MENAGLYGLHKSVDSSTTEEYTLADTQVFQNAILDLVRVGYYE